MKYDAYSPATRDTIAAYLDSPQLTGEKTIDAVGVRLSAPLKALAATAQLVYHLGVEVFARLLVGRHDEKGQRSLLAHRVSVWQDRNHLKAYFKMLWWPSAGRAYKLIADLNATSVTKLLVAKGTNGGWQYPQPYVETQVRALEHDACEEVACDEDHKKTMGMLVAATLLPAASRGRTARFRQHYLTEKVDYAVAINTALEFLKHADSLRAQPPLVLHSPLIVESSYETSIPDEVEHHYWLLVARLRLEVFANKEKSAQMDSELPKEIEAFVKTLSQKLEASMGKEYAENASRSFLRWVNPSKQEPLIYQKTFALPTLDLLGHHTLQAEERRYDDIAEERACQENLLKFAKNLYAHGIATKRGGIKNLLNIMLEGYLCCEGVGPLKDGDPRYCAGPHGPIFVILKREFVVGNEVEEEGHLSYVDCNDFGEEGHLAYIVPNQRDEALVTSTVEKAVERGFLTKLESKRLLGKLLTYKELLDLPVRGRDGDIDERRLVAAMQQRVNTQA